MESKHYRQIVRVGAIFICASFLLFGGYVHKAQAAQITLYAQTDGMSWAGTANGWNTAANGSGTSYSNPHNGDGSGNTYITDLNGKHVIDDTDITVDKIQDSTATGYLDSLQGNSITVLNGGFVYSGTGTGGMLRIGGNNIVTMNGSVTNSGIGGRAIVIDSSPSGIVINAGIGNTALTNTGGFAIVTTGPGNSVKIIGAVNAKSSSNAILATSGSGTITINNGTNDAVTDAGSVVAATAVSAGAFSTTIIGNVVYNGGGGFVTQTAGSLTIIGNVTLGASSNQGIRPQGTTMYSQIGNVTASAGKAIVYTSSITTSSITGTITVTGSAYGVYSTAGLITVNGTTTGAQAVFGSPTNATIVSNYISFNPVITVPANHNSYVPINVVGQGATSWNGSETITASNSIAGRTDMAVGTWSISDSTHGTVLVKTPSASAWVRGSAYTAGQYVIDNGVTWGCISNVNPSNSAPSLDYTHFTRADNSVFKILVDGIPYGVVRVAQASFSLDTTGGDVNTAYNLTLTGTDTRWLDDINAGNFTTSDLFTASTGATISNVSVNSNTGATLTLTIGSVPARITITDASTGVTSLFTAITENMYNLAPAAVGVGSYIQPEGGMTWVNGLYKNYSTANSASTFYSGAVRFVAAMSQIDVYINSVGSPVRINIDGVDSSVSATPFTQDTRWVTIATGLDSSNLHTYVLTFGSVVGLQSIRTFGGTGISTTSLPARPLLVIYGDSITSGGTFETPADSTRYYAYALARNMNYQIANRGLSGTRVWNSGSDTASGQYRTADAITSPIPASVIFNLYGTNDQTLGTTALNFTTAYSAMLTAQRAGNAHALIINERLLKTAIGDTIKDAFSAIVSSDVAAQADAKDIYVSGMWGAYTGVDGIHPNPSATPNQIPGIATAAASDISANLTFLVATPAVSGTPTQTTLTILSAGGSGGTGAYTYQWFRSTTSGWSGLPIAGGTSLTLNDTGLTENTTYYYTLQATDSVGLSAFSSQAHVSTQATDTTGPTGTISNGNGSPTNSVIVSYGSSGSFVGYPTTPTSLQINAIVPIVPTSYKFYKDLSYRMTHPDVKELQKYLNTHGVIVAPSGAGSPGKETNYFGVLTYRAVVKFQKSIGWSGTGFFGPMTRAFINE